MKKIINILSGFCVAVYHLISFIVLEIYKLFKYLFIGMFKFFDIFFTGLIYLGGYIGLGVYEAIKFLYKYIKKFMIFIYNKIIKNFIMDLWNGTKFLSIYIFYKGPKYIINLLSKLINDISNKIKVSTQMAKERAKSTPNKIKNYFKNKWDNFSFVKHYRNKLERELEVLYLDKSGKDAERTQTKQAYQYLARNKDGKLIKGYFSALSRLDVHSYLLDEGFEVYQIKTSKSINFLHGESQYLKTPIKHKDLIFWLTQLSTYVKSGIPLTESIKILAVQNKNSRFKKIYDSMIYELTMGETFSESLKKQGNVYPALLINMIKAAEMIGDIEGTLDDMADYYTQRENTRKTMISAITYPSIIFVFSIIVVSFIFIFIIPKFVDVYKSAGIEMNPFTLAILNISNFLMSNYIFIILFIVGGISILKVLYDNVKAFRTLVQFVIMHIPVVGKIIIYNEITLFSKTFAVLNSNNVMLTESIELLGKITSNEIYKTIMYDTISNLLRGEKMSDTFKNNWAIPSLAYHMIQTGESTGELALMLGKVSEYYQKEQTNIAGTIKSFLEPIMIAGLAIIVGGIIIAVIVPMFSMYGAVA
ncbi:MAG: type II secretion system F family protein [Bacilli bacterium]